jgi:hypothetical protein
MEPAMQPVGGKKSNLPAIIAAVALIVGFGAGFFVGNLKGESTGESAAEQKYAPVVDSVFPKPPDELTTLSGTVTNLYGATIELSVYDPNDYLPHADGSPRQSQTRTANVTGTTTYTLTDFGNLDRQGNPTRTTIAFKDLKVGDTVTVESGSNIKDAQSFDVTAVEVVKY